MTDMISILGTGAMGCLLAGQLSKAQISVQLILRDKDSQAKYEKQHGVQWQGKENNNFYLPTTLANDPSPIKILLLTTKAHHAHSALQSIAHRLTPESVIIIFCNGLGVREELQSAFPSLSFFSGCLYSAAHRHAPFTITPITVGPIYFGPDTASHRTQIHHLLSCFEHAGFATTLTDQINALLWEKFTVNCVINPLTALFSMPNGALTQTKWLDIIRALCQEIAAVAQAFEHPYTADFIFSKVQQIASQTAENYTSMLQDVRAKQPTEINYLNNYLVHCAEKKHIPVPMNQLITRLLTEGQAYEKNLA